MDPGRAGGGIRGQGVRGWRRARVAGVAARVVSDLMRLCFLLERTYAPYSKWLGTAYARLDAAATVGPHLAAAVAADNYPRREESLVLAYEEVALRHNAAQISDPEEPTARLFHDRPFRVIGAGRFAQACVEAIDEPALRALPLVGAIDQWVDSTDVLSHAGRADVSSIGSVLSGEPPATASWAAASPIYSAAMQPAVADAASVVDRRYGTLHVHGDTVRRVRLRPSTLPRHARGCSRSRRRIAEHLTLIVRAATAGEGGQPWVSALPCRRRPGRRPCSGHFALYRADVLHPSSGGAPPAVTRASSGLGRVRVRPSASKA